ncbi:MAG: hypothetical protein Q27BB25_13755 [Blastomonas sp. CACIA14H2]|nr:MAG: hypothetical protein Q27BB25_13755 [Blastomonas sp. CACIA14H2]
MPDAGIKVAASDGHQRRSMRAAVDHRAGQPSRIAAVALQTACARQIDRYGSGTGERAHAARIARQPRNEFGFLFGRKGTRIDPGGP